MISKTNPLPAVALGGPPHSGKSVLAYSLSHALRLQNVPHYVLRAHPDGEGDWANEADGDLVRALRVKGVGTPEWTRRVARDISARPLPLIVDPGGKPTTWQEAIFRECTHGILLCPDAISHAEWLERFQAHDLVLLADLKSDLYGKNMLESDRGHLRGTLAGLERGQIASGPAFERLVEWLARLFAYSANDLRELHLKQAPTETVVELDRLGRTLCALDSEHQWVASELPRVLDYLPRAKPIALYDRAPNWLYAALALHALPGAIYQFDARLGWISPPLFEQATPDRATPLHNRLTQFEAYAVIEFELADPYLDYSNAGSLAVPQVPEHAGLVLDGRLPLWVWTALARAYANTSWLAVYQPQLYDHALVIHSRTSTPRVGALVPYSPRRNSIEQH